MINISSILIKDIKNRCFNFKNLLNKTDTIIWKECNNLIINVKKKINKFEFTDCSDIKLKLKGTIAGLEINNCKNFILEVPNNHNISCIDAYKSKIIIKGDYQEIKKIKILKENCRIDFIN